MIRWRVLGRVLLAAAPAAVFLVMLGACAPTGRGGMPTQQVPERTPPPPPPAEEPPVADEPYDLEDEMPVEGAPGRQVVEEIEPIRVDTFRVEEIAQPADEGGYDLGYRIQVFASSSLDAAKEVQKKIMAGTGLAAYIEFEEGLYKVRAGDFSTREEASTARAALSQTYPDCWIVRTTVRTVR